MKGGALFLFGAHLAEAIETYGIGFETVLRRIILAAAFASHSRSFHAMPIG
jgi:hypothetical protein